jgi:hypothetical protein
MRGRMIKGHRSANHGCGFATPAMAEDFVMLADLLAREIEKLRSADAGLARQPVSLAVGHEREIAGLKQARLSAFDLPSIFGFSSQSGASPSRGPCGS